MDRSSIQEESIPLAASKFRADDQIPIVKERIDSHNYLVFKVDFEDESWAIRMPVLKKGDWSPEFITSLIEREARVLEDLEKKGFRWAPRLRGYDSSFENPIGYPFVAVTWIQGKKLEWTEDMERSLRDGILEQLAGIHTSLIACSSYTATSTSTEHITQIIQNKVGRIRKGTLPELTEQDVSEQMDLLPNVLRPELDTAPFAVDQGAFGMHNVIIDEGILTGVVGWGLSSDVPFQMAACFPAILRLDDIDQPPSSLLKEDREKYIAAAKALTQWPEVTDLMVPVISDSSLELNTLFLEAVISKGRHRELARAGWRDAPALQ